MWWLGSRAQANRPCAVMGGNACTRAWCAPRNASRRARSGRLARRSLCGPHPCRPAGGDLRVVYSVCSATCRVARGPEAGGSAWVPQRHQRRRPTTPVSSDRCVRNPRQRRRCPEGGPFRRMQAIPPNPRAFDRHKCLLQFWAAGRDHRAEDTRAKKHRKRGPDGGDRWPDDWPRNPPSLHGASPPRSINRSTSI